MSGYLSFTSLYYHRELLYELIKRQIIVRYKQSYLGPAWAFFQPLALMVIFTIVRSFVGISSEGIPYPIFVYSALLPWTFFANSISIGTPSIVQNASIIQKIYFPRELFPVAAVISSFYDFLIASIIYIGLMIFYKIQITVWII
ncbi:MAG: ABC transporter permease, partial [Elusimicrobia bacterium]|nr:ABC transporter permease [Elusimicrobiota bacterium]